MHANMTQKCLVSGSFYLCYLVDLPIHQVRKVFIYQDRLAREAHLCQYVANSTLTRQNYFNAHRNPKAHEHRYQQDRVFDFAINPEVLMRSKD